MVAVVEFVTAVILATPVRPPTLVTAPVKAAHPPPAPNETCATANPEV